MENEEFEKIEKFLGIYHKKRNPYVFAPLAENYRKVGKVDEAITILNSGIKKYAHYRYAHIVRGHCYFDKGNLEDAYKELKPWAESDFENYSLQRLFALCCEGLNLINEALISYKCLQYLSPRDKNIKEKIDCLERGISSSKDTFCVEDKEKEDSEKDKVKDEVEEKKDKDLETDDWSYFGEEKNTFIIETQVEGELVTFDKSTGDFNAQGPDLPLEDKGGSSSNDEEEDSPFISYTLVDLYLTQGHPKKALEILYKMEELSPNLKTQIKIKNIERDFLVSGKNIDDERRALPQKEKNVMQSKGHHDKKYILLDIYSNFLKEIKERAKTM